MIPAKGIALLCAAAIAGCAPLRDAGHAAADRSYANPVLDRDFPDPAVLATADGWYYAFATQTIFAGGAINIQVGRSRDLVRWEHLGEALPAKPTWASATQNFWAPHVLHDPGLGRFVMYYSAEPEGARGRCLAVATARSPDGPYADSGRPLICGDGLEHIDPMAFDDPRTGKRLLYWGSASRPIRVQELSADRLGFLEGSRPVEVAFPDERIGFRRLIEGAWVIYRNGTYFLFYSGEHCCGTEARYAIMAARSNSAFGPFEHFPGPGGTSVIVGESAAWRAPGHNSIVSDAGGADWMLYHAYSTASNDASPGRRVMLLDPITYREGWPRVAGDRPSSSPRNAPALPAR